MTLDDYGILIASCGLVQSQTSRTVQQKQLAKHLDLDPYFITGDRLFSQYNICFHASMHISAVLCVPQNLEPRNICKSLHPIPQLYQCRQIYHTWILWDKHLLLEFI